MLEDALKQIRALLQNQLPAKLDQIELERADGVALEDVQSFLIQTGGGSTPGRMDGRHKYPGVTLVGEAINATNAISRRRELRHRISIWVTDRVVAPDSELAQTRLLRYMEAVERILAFDPSLGGKAVNSVVTSHWYTRKEGKEGEEFIKRAVLVIEVLERLSTNNY